MDLLEYEGKALFAEVGLVVPKSVLAATPNDAVAAATELGLPVVVKAQAKTGGRGNAGGICICQSAGEVRTAADEILRMTIRGKRVQSLLIEEVVDVEREFYVAITASRLHRGPLLVFSGEGGTDIEELAHRDPHAMRRMNIDPLAGLCDYQVRDIVAAATLDASARESKHRLASVVRGLWKLYEQRDATLVEVNPLALTKTGEMVCLDSKVSIDDNALSRQDLTADEPGDEREAKAHAAGLAFVPLDGDIGVMGNGAGLVMSTIDQIAAAGGRAADFCDIGGGARVEKVSAALRAILAGPPVTAVLVNIFGGITRCDTVAEGLVEALNAMKMSVPVVVRLDGNAADEGRKTLTRAAIDSVMVCDSASHAVQTAVSLSRSAGLDGRR